MKNILTLLIISLYSWSFFSQTTGDVSQEKYFYKSKIPQFISFSEKSELKIEELSSFFFRTICFKYKFDRIKTDKR